MHCSPGSSMTVTKQSYMKSVCRFTVACLVLTELCLVRLHFHGLNQGVIKRCRLSWLTKSAFVYERRGELRGFGQ
jgi:hypothetical protein